jgi:hypothetical protein
MGEAIAFAPQTFISPFMRLRHGDRRWRRQIWKTYAMDVTRKRVLGFKGTDDADAVRLQSINASFRRMTLSTVFMRVI